MGMRRRRLLLASIAIVVALVFLGTTVWLTWRAARRSFVQEVFTAKEQVIDVSSLVIQVRELSRLETASMRVMHVGTIKQSYSMVPNALAGDELTFLATGDVIAGMDLSQLKQEDVWREPDGTVTMRLPPPIILVSRVDNKESRVLSRKTGALRRADVDLETRARQHAEQNITNEALKKGVLRMAGQNSEKKLADFLRVLGFTRVRFVSHAQPQRAPLEQ